MARNKKPRKKYTAPHNLLASSGIYAGDIARLSVKKTGLDDRTRDIAIKPFRIFIAELKKGMADVQMYCDAYTRFIQYHELLCVLLQADIRADNMVEMLFRTETSIRREKCLLAVNTLSDIATRGLERGRWVATGEELKILDNLLEDMEYIYSVASWCHFMEALKRGQPLISRAFHGLDKRTVDAA